jgi:hypothetical protein
MCRSKPIRPNCFSAKIGQIRRGNHPNRRSRVQIDTTENHRKILIRPPLLAHSVAVNRTAVTGSEFESSVSVPSLVTRCTGFFWRCLPCGQEPRRRPMNSPPVSMLVLPLHQVPSAFISRTPRCDSIYPSNVMVRGADPRGSVAVRAKPLAIDGPTKERLDRADVAPGARAEVYSSSRAVDRTVTSTPIRRGSNGRFHRHATRIRLVGRSGSSGVQTPEHNGAPGARWWCAIDRPLSPIISTRSR